MVNTILVLSLATQLSVNPFESKLENAMETASLLTLLLSYSVSSTLDDEGVLVPVDDESWQRQVVVSLAQVLNDLMLIVFIVVLVLPALKHAWYRCTGDRRRHEGNVNASIPDSSLPASSTSHTVGE